jgi:acyl dehydratase
MPLRAEIIGQERLVAERTWTSSDAIRYALGVGAGLGDPAAELAFTTENSEGIEQRVLPTYGVILASSGLMSGWGTFDRSMVVHGEQRLRLHRPIPVEGRADVRSTVVAIEDRRPGAFVRTVTTVTGPEGPLVTAESGVIVRGEPGLQPVQKDPQWRVPARPPDQVRVLATRPEQALLYRLSGDRNPLHSDPAVARRAGFDRPVLHGLCTFGFAGRALLAGLADGDPARFRSISARFSRPVRPGDSLVVQIWAEAGTAVFRVSNQDGDTVLDRGAVQYQEVLSS